jgi:hypothetical protein
MKTVQRTDTILQGLMFQWLNWGDEECLSGVRGFADKPETKRPFTVAASSYIPLKEITRLNAICSGCRDVFFKIEKKECLICGSDQVEPMIKKESVSSPLLFIYKCEDCGRLLFSDMELKD